MKKNLCAALLIALLAVPMAAFGSEYDADMAAAWLVRFCDALTALEMNGNPEMTADPARPGEYLLEYSFGTVTATSDDQPGPDEIREINVRTQQVTDCRGMRVGMSLEEILEGCAVGRSNTQLYVLSTQDAGLGFAWAYLGDGGVYGVEYITYGGEGADVKEYTLTYVIDDQGLVSAIRLRCAQTTQAQAQQAMDTAEEIAQRQRGEVYAVRNEAAALVDKDLQIMGVRALGTQVADLIAMLGEPVEIQTLSGSQGRLLLYEGAAIELMLNEQTGEEVVCGVSASASDVAGPRRLSVGMSVQEAASLFRCDEDVYAMGGILYADGDARGELVRGDLGTEAKLRYVTAGEQAAVLEISVKDGMVGHWHFYLGREEVGNGN